MTWYRDRLPKLAELPHYHNNRSMINLKIINLKTEEDVVKLKEGLRDLPGVISIYIDFMTSKLTVWYNTEETTIQQIAYAVRELGFNYIGRT
ncbi:MAG: heavy-metal-associated domain-containing protein [Firmicutes bacterium]|jgi:copper chaperone CopZ|nr:heavy-metal-associated domain-containing protein [Bacillota bacterium]